MLTSTVFAVYAVPTVTFKSKTRDWRPLLLGATRAISNACKAFEGKGDACGDREEKGMSSETGGQRAGTTVGKTRFQGCESKGKGGNNSDTDVAVHEPEL